MPDYRPDWRLIVRSRLRADAVEEDALDEVGEHAEELYRACLAEGRQPRDAQTIVEAELVDVPALMRDARAARRRRIAAAPEPVSPGPLSPLSTFARDFAYGARLLVGRPAFTAIAVITLALGIGANTAIFSIVNVLFLKPLPFPHADRLVMTWETDIREPDDVSIVSAPNWLDWQRQSTSFEHMAIWENLRFNLSGDADPEQVFGMRVSSGLFPMLGLEPQLGRTFTAAEEAPGHNLVVISDALWRQRYGGAREVIGKVTRVNGRPHEIIGVMPPTFIFEQQRQQVWVPIAFNPNDADRGSHSFRSAARLKAGVTFEAAQAEMDAIGRRLGQEYQENRNQAATITRMTELGVEFLKPTLYALLGAVALVLLIACVNVANLLIAQSIVRQREFAIRAALGAGRGRLISQLLAEGLLLSLAGAAAGLALAWLGTAALDSALPASIRFAPFRERAGTPIDATVLMATLGIAVLTGVIFSLAPILGIARIQPGVSLKESGTRGGTARFTGFRNLLVAAEVALAVIVLAGAGLMIKSMGRLLAVDPGLDPTQVLLMDIALPQEDFYGAPVRTSFCADLDREVGAVPGVSRLGAISHLPLSGANAGRSLTIEGRPVPTRDDRASASYRLTCPGYFAALGIPVLRGRDFTHADATAAPGAVIVNESTARAYWGDQDPVGRRMKLGDPTSENPWLTVVGVVRDVRHFGLDAEMRREMFRPYSQAAWPQMTVTIKAAGDPLAIAATAREGLRRIDADQPVTRITTMHEVVEESVGGRKFPMLLMTLFSVIALVLAAIGVYGVVSYVVSQRTREIGIRMALGARAVAVVLMVVRRSLMPICAGLLVGVAAAGFASQLLASLLYEVQPRDPAVLGVIVAVLGLSAIAACLVPALRAASVDPLIVLKEE
ncbi:MAG: ABC transporter permease [Vicinamibacterales bacterium]